MVSIHTFELAMEVDRETFYNWRDRVKSKSKYNKEEERDYTLVKNGITVWYHKTEFKKKIKLIVNPSRLLGYDDLIELWEPKRKNVARLLVELEKHIASYFDSEYELNDFKLSRIDFTKNIRLDSSEKVSAYIKVLYNIRKVKGFSPKYGSNDDWYDEDLSFDLEGNSNGIEFTAYDKEAAIEQNIKNKEFKRKEMGARKEIARGILRIEVRLVSQKAIRSYTNEDETVKRIINLSEKRDKIFMDTFIHVVPFGDFYKKDHVIRIINEKVTDKKLKTKMVRLLELIPKKKSLYLALKEMSDRNIDRILDEFHKSNISPVTISKRHNIKHLKNLYIFLNNKQGRAEARFLFVIHCIIYTK